MDERQQMLKGGLAVFGFAGLVELADAPQVVGAKGLVGEIGIARTKIAPEGKVFVHGEHWNVTSEEVINEGERIRVVEVGNLDMKVEKA